MEIKGSRAVSASRKRGGEVEREVREDNRENEVSVPHDHNTCAGDKPGRLMRDGDGSLNHVILFQNKDEGNPPLILPLSGTIHALTGEGRQGDGHAGGGRTGSGLGCGVQRIAHHKGVACHGKGCGPEDDAVGLHDGDGKIAVCGVDGEASGGSTLLARGGCYETGISWTPYLHSKAMRWSRLVESVSASMDLSAVGAQNLIIASKPQQAQACLALILVLAVVGALSCLDTPHVSKPHPPRPITIASRSSVGVTRWRLSYAKLEVVCAALAWPTQTREAKCLAARRLHALSTIHPPTHTHHSLWLSPPRGCFLARQRPSSGSRSSRPPSRYILGREESRRMTREVLSYIAPRQIGLRLPIPSHVLMLDILYTHVHKYAL